MDWIIMAIPAWIWFGLALFGLACVIGTFRKPIFNLLWAAWCGLHGIYATFGRQK